MGARNIRRSLIPSFVGWREGGEGKTINLQRGDSDVLIGRCSRQQTSFVRRPKPN